METNRRGGQCRTSKKWDDHAPLRVLDFLLPRYETIFTLLMALFGCPRIESIRNIAINPLSIRCTALIALDTEIDFLTILFHKKKLNVRRLGGVGASVNKDKNATGVKGLSICVGRHF